jgi:hypothetical protein
MSCPPATTAAVRLLLTGATDQPAEPGAAIETGPGAFIETLTCTTGHAI